MSNNEVVIGVIEEIVPKTTQYGTFWDVIVNGQKFGVGKVKPKFEKGECVKFRVSRNGNFSNVAPGSLEKHEGDVPSANTELVKELDKPATAPTTYADRDTDRQRSIILQSARKDAIEVAKLLVSADCIGFKSTSKWAEKHDIVLAKINDLTRTFYHNTCNHAEFVGAALPKVDKEETGE
jgi:hypothetical protein